MTLRVRAKVLSHVWSYDFYDMPLSIEQQRRHMINIDSTHCRIYIGNKCHLFQQITHLRLSKDINRFRITVMNPNQSFSLAVRSSWRFVIQIFNIYGKKYKESESKIKQSTTTRRVFFKCLVDVM